MIQEVYKKLNKKWCNSMIILVVGFLFAFFCSQIPIEFAYNYSIFIFLFSVLIVLILGIIRLFKKDYFQGILQIIMTLAIGVIGFAFFLLTLFFFPHDYFAKNLKIPQNIKFEKPLNFNDSIKPETLNGQIPTLILHDGFQPGIYQYELYLNKIEKGFIYLKIYEITQNEILSEESIKESSKINVYNPTHELKKFKLKEDFTISEGNWGEYYGSRIEVWYQPENKNEKERKLFSKNYIIQGWER